MAKDQVAGSTALGVSTAKARYKPKHAIRIVTAAALFDGHDASINLMRRLLQDAGAEVVHLGHNRSVLDVVKDRKSVV